jgi:hypothetical protein
MSQVQAADLLNVSTRLVADARIVLDSGREDLIEGVDAGAMKVSTAANKLKEREMAPKVDEAVRMAAALDVVEGGLSEAQAKDKYGITKHAVREAVIAERARRENEPLDPTSFDPPTRQQFEALLEKEKRRLEAEFARRVQEAVDKRIDEEIWPIYQERASESTLLVKRRKGQMTKEEYSLVLRCLHPDQSASKETLTRAFQIFRQLELIFLDENQRPTPGVPTLEEAMKMAMERKAAKQAAKQAAKKKKQKSAVAA